MQSISGTHKHRAAIITLGCKVNQYESEAIAEELERKGFEICQNDGECELYIINTCTVTAESDRKSRQIIRRALSQNPSAYIIVTGCSAQYDADRIAAINGVDYVIGNKEKMKVAKAALALITAGVKNTTPVIDVPPLDGARFEPMTIRKFDRTRAYIKIQDGCESRCAYCTIPAVRGKIRSKPSAEVIREVEELTHTGCGEIVLTGIETGAYGRDMGDIGLADLMERIDSIEGIGRVRTGSLDPSVITEAFVDKIARLSSPAPHYHLSLQSGCSATLARMRRKYNADMAMRALERLRRAIPDVQFTTDVIVGFPDEGEEEFKETLDFVKRARFLKIHVFPYSIRTGTEAAKMKGQIPDAVKRERVKILSALEAEIRADVLDEYLKVHTRDTVLFETFHDGYAYGHTPSFIEVKVKSNTPLKGELRHVFPASRDGDFILAELGK